MRSTAFLSSVSALVLGPLCAQSALAATVTNCNDAGAGSLRSAIAATASGGTVTFSPALAACTITLTTATIPVSATNLTIQGPVSNSFTVDGAQNYRIFSHSGTGTLAIEHLALVNGKYKGPGSSAKGGCILSNGSVSVTGSTLTNCTAYSTATTGKARGGAIYAKGALSLVHSTISGSSAIALGGAYGGGVNGLSLDAQYSTFDSNYATLPSGKAPAAGALWEGGAARVGSGTTSITNSTLTNNKANGANNYFVGTAAKGGAVFAAGAAYFGSSTISHSYGGSEDNTQGGAIYALTSLTLAHSVVSDNSNFGANGCFGGALRASDLVVGYTTIHGNSVFGSAGDSGGGAMFVVNGSAQIDNSIVDGNAAGGGGGGLFTVSSNITLINSTFSGNHAYGAGAIPAGSGGIQMTGAAATLHISNSTIAFNIGSGGANPYLGGGVRAYGTAVIQSSIIANNTMDVVPSDLSCNCGMNAAKKISGANNLIMSVDPGAVAPPAGMIILTADPKLVPLGNHGGETRTHALIAGSPALGVGNNIGNFSTEQRGIGYPRLNAGAADIGAYERQPNDDEIFYDGLQ